MHETAQVEPVTTNPTTVSRLIPIGEVAAIMGLSVTTIERLNASGKLPLPRRIGKSNRWDRVELEAWIGRPKPDGSLLNRREWSPVWASIVKAGSR